MRQRFRHKQYTFLSITRRYRYIISNYNNNSNNNNYNNNNYKNNNYYNYYSYYYYYLLFSPRLTFKISYNMVCRLRLGESVAEGDCITSL